MMIIPLVMDRFLSNQNIVIEIMFAKKLITILLKRFGFSQKQL